MKSSLLIAMLSTLPVWAEEGEKTELPVETPAGDVPPEGSGDEDIAKEVTKGVRVEDVVEPTADYHYAQFGKGDPFVPPLTLSPEVKDRIVMVPVSGTEIPIVSPLQRFAVNELNLLGIWQLSSGERKGMVMTPQGGTESGLGIIVRVGDPIGKRGGRVIAIASDYLTVREFSLAPDGTRQYEDQQMYMGRWSSGLDVSGKISFKPGAKESDVQVNEPPGGALEFAAPKAAAVAPANDAQPVGGGDAKGEEAANPAAEGAAKVEGKAEGAGEAKIAPENAAKK